MLKLSFSQFMILPTFSRPQVTDTAVLYGKHNHLMYKGTLIAAETSSLVPSIHHRVHTALGWWATQTEDMKLDRGHLSERCETFARSQGCTTGFVNNE